MPFCGHKQVREPHISGRVSTLQVTWRRTVTRDPLLRKARVAALPIPEPDPVIKMHAAAQSTISNETTGQAFGQTACCSEVTRMELA